VPSIEENLKMWNVDFDWSREEWAGNWWDCAAAMWYGLVYPRVWRFLPAPTILEIAPGFGRWTEFLLDHCDTLIGIDISDKCIEACRQRFADRSGATFETNDGHSLPMVADSSVDFAFSLDSLIHAEADTLKGYLTELARVLKPDGVAVLHHSNYAAYQHSMGYLNELTRVLKPDGVASSNGADQHSTRAQSPLRGAFNHLPASARHRLNRIRTEVGNSTFRAQGVSAARFTGLCEKAGMRCVGQELVNWNGGVFLIDSISVVTRPGSRWDRPNRVVKNRRLGSVARSIGLGSAYDLSAQPSA
jgi:SAM-dependent methyltransferase